MILFSNIHYTFRKYSIPKQEFLQVTPSSNISSEVFGKKQFL